MRASAWALVIFASAAAAPAAAATLDEASLGFHVRAEAPGVRVCRILPREPEGTPGCEGLNVAAGEATAKESADKVAALAILRVDDWSAVVTVKGVPDASVHNAEQIAGYFEGMKIGAARDYGVTAAQVEARGDTPGTTHDVLQLNGVNTARSSLAITVPETHPMHSASHWRTYMFAGESGIVSLSFLSDAEHAARVVPLADAIARTVSMRHADKAEFGKSRSYFIGKLVGMALVPIVVLLGAAIAGLITWRAGQKKKAAELRR